jgi:hypothetical protein
MHLWRRDFIKFVFGGILMVSLKHDGALKIRHGWILREDDT